MGRMSWASLLRAVIFVWIIGLLWIQPAEAATELNWLEALPADSTGFQRALGVKDWNFPRDFGAHESYQTEWWYYTGNLTASHSETDADREFGFQLTFFRQALKPEAERVGESSDWRGNQIYSAHFTISDIAEQQFYPTERFSRGTLGLAGAKSQPYEVWLEDWSATEIEPGKVRLQAKTAEVALDLIVEQTLPPVLQGDRGLSVKGKEVGNASYYYSLVQQPTAGTVEIKGKPYAVTGLTWKDHEYSTSALTAGTVGWDWFSMQFDNGSALMLYLLRNENGTLERTSAGKYIAASGETMTLSGEDWRVEVLDSWTSPRNGAVYPAKWTIEIPKLELVLRAEPLMPNQELNMATATYWEGAVGFKGKQGTELLNGKGYVELTGYASRLDALLSARTP